MISGKCIPTSFDYYGRQHCLIGNTNEFIVERIQVFQMRLLEHPMKSIIYTKNIEKNSKLIQQTMSLQRSFSHEIQQLEKWTNTTFESILFDSTIHDWHQFTSEFNTNDFTL